MSNDIHPLKTLSPYCARWAQENKPPSKEAIYGFELNGFFFIFDVYRTFTTIPCACTCTMSVPSLLQMPWAVWADAKCEQPPLDTPPSLHIQRTALCLLQLTAPPPLLLLLSLFFFTTYWNRARAQALEVKYILMHCDNPFIKKKRKAGWKLQDCPSLIRKGGVSLSLSLCPIAWLSCVSTPRKRLA